MHYLYPHIEDGTIDHAFAQEQAHWAVLSQPQSTSLLCYDTLMRGQIIEVPQGKTVVYRGWPLPSDAYDVLAESVRQRGSVMLVSPAQYRLAHDLLRWYPLVTKEFAPWLPRPLLEDVSEELKELMAQETPNGVQHRVLITQGNMLPREDMPSSAKEFIHTLINRLPLVFAVVDVVQSQAQKWYVSNIEDAQVLTLEEWPVEVRLAHFPRPVSLSDEVKADLVRQEGLR